jgi:hypothetical protein
MIVTLLTRFRPVPITELAGVDQPAFIGGDPHMMGKRKNKSIIVLLKACTL